MCQQVSVGAPVTSAGEGRLGNRPPASRMGHAPDRALGKRVRSQAGGGIAHDASSAERPAKHVKRGHQTCDAVVRHALLAQYYPELQTLRQFALAKLPASSRIRRRKIASLGLGQPSPDKPHTAEELALADLLDTTIVARRGHDDTSGADHRWQQWVSFSQKGDESYVTLSDGLKGSTFSQSEVRG